MSSSARQPAAGGTVVRYYTRGLRFPRLVGKTVDGTRIPGGPYTTTQAVGGLVTFLAAQFSHGLWGTGDLLTDFAVTGCLVAGTVVGLKFVRAGGRSPTQAALAVARLAFQPHGGRLEGRKLRIRGAHRAVLDVLVLAPVTASSHPEQTPQTQETAPVPVASVPAQRAAPTAAATPAIQLSSVARLLAAASAQQAATPIDRKETR